MRFSASVTYANVSIGYQVGVLIITALKWIALDLPEEDVRIEKKISIPELFGSCELELVVVR